MAKVTFIKEDCIGCGSCAAICPSYWEMGDDGKAHLKESTEEEDGTFTRELESLECNSDAAQSCPVQCIKAE